MYSYIQCVQCDPEAQELDWNWKDLINTVLCFLTLSVQVFSAAAPMTFLVKVHWKCTQFEYTINIDFISLSVSGIYIGRCFSLLTWKKQPIPLKRSRVYVYFHCAWHSDITVQLKSPISNVWCSCHSIWWQSQMLTVIQTGVCDGG